MNSAIDCHRRGVRSSGEPIAADRAWPASGAGRICWALSTVLFFLGCRPAEQIETYRVSVPEQPAARTAEPASSGPPTHRMLAAIVPDGERAWFLKAVGPTGALEEQAEAVSDFFASVRLGDGQSQPQWNLPEGWTEQAGSGMRAATITIPAEPEPLELTVIALPWRGGQSEVLSNVNRWRGQLQMAPIGVEGLADCTRETSTDGTVMTIVDLQGRWQDSGMTAPFAGGRPAAGGMPGSRSPALPMAAQPTSPHFTAPESWEELPAVPPRRAAFRIEDGSREALMTVIDFPTTAGSMIADPLANLNRWRREVGLAPIDAATLDEAVGEIDVDGQSGSYFAILPDVDNEEESMAERATLAAMVTHGGSVWFFKLSGDRDLVAAQEENFRSFLESVQLEPDGGAGDGN